MDDIKYMKKALRLAELGRGHTSPNPMVGCVIVKDGKIIGHGYHRCYGEKHAEAAAIDNARESVEGATLYCNLEPCCHTIPGKKTPPCAQRIIKEKIGRVVTWHSSRNRDFIRRSSAVERKIFQIYSDQNAFCSSENCPIPRWTHRHF